MRIGIDARVLGTNKALDRYTRSLISELLKVDKRNQYFLFIDDVKKLNGLESVSYFLLPPKQVLTDHLRFSRLIKDSKVDLVFHPDNTEFLNCHPKSIVTLHDVIPWKFPEMILSQNPLLRARQLLYFKLQETALRKASQIITVSENSKKDISEIIGIETEKISVIYEGVEEVFSKKVNNKVLTNLGITGDYIFYIGGFSPHKNVVNLIKAFALLKDMPLTLVLGGKLRETKGGQSSFSEIMTIILKENLKGQVIFTDFLDDSDLATLYQNAKVFVYPSIYEGFGFPPLEAMMASVAVIASGRGSLHEILGDAYLQTETTNEKDLADNIRKLLIDKKLAGDLIAKGKRQVAKYTWEKTAKETIAVFDKFK